MMQVAKKIPFDDPNVLNMCRALYIGSNLIIMGIYLYIKTVIDKKKGMSISYLLSQAGRASDWGRQANRIPPRQT